MTRTIELAVFTVVLFVAALAGHAWLASRDELRLLQSTLTTQKQVIDAADSRERSRDAALNDALAQIATEKRATQTPVEALRALPKFLTLPQPITLAAPQPSTTQLQQGTAQTGSQSHPPVSSSQLVDSPLPLSPSGARAPSPAAVSSAPVAQIPAADLKPLYDYVQDCRSCQLELTAAKIAALTHERDAAVTAAKGGSFLRRLRRNALRFLVGASAGYVAAKR